jgi:hypothetical protein
VGSLRLVSSSWTATSSGLSARVVVPAVHPRTVLSIDDDGEGSRGDAWPLAGNPNEHVGNRHHLVPQLYLQRFGRGDRIAVVDVHTGVRRVSPIADTAAERDFYSFINTQGELDGRLEHMLSQVEGDGARVIKNLTSVFFQEPSADDREALSVLLAFQMVRGREFRRRGELLADLTMRLPLSFVTDEQSARSALQARGIMEPSEAEILELISACDELDSIEFVPDPNDHMRMMGPLAMNIMPHLLNRPWVLIEFPEPALLTSDEPVALYSAGEHDEYESLSVPGAREIYFPLDPKRLLILGHPEDLDRSFIRVEGRPEWADLSNWLMSVYAYQYLFLHPEHDIRMPPLPEERPLFRVTDDASPVLSRYNQPPAHRRTQRRRAGDGRRRSP